MGFWESLLNALLDSLRLGLPYAMLALGVFITYRQLDIADLGCEGTFTLGGAVIGILVYKDVNPFLGILIVLLSGFLAGVLTGILHTQLKIPALLSGIITLTALFTINMVIMGFGVPSSSNKSFFAKLFDNKSSLISLYRNVNRVESRTIYTMFHNLLTGIGIPIGKQYSYIILNILIVVAVVFVLYIFFGTEVGMSIRSTGMNPLMSRAQGINTSLMIVLGLGISNAVIALGGAMFTQINLSASNTMGVGAIIIGLASIIIGESIFGKRTFKNWLISVVLGAIVYYLIIAIALALKLPDHYLKFLYALLIVIVLIVPFVKEKIVGISAKKRGVN